MSASLRASEQERYLRLMDWSLVVDVLFLDGGAGGHLRYLRQIVTCVETVLQLGF
jgi:hypothetical protein